MDEYVKTRLKEKGLEDYIDLFSDNKIDQEAFLALTSDDLKDLVPKLGPRKKIIELIEFCKKENENDVIEETKISPPDLKASECDKAAVSNKNRINYEWIEIVKNFVGDENLEFELSKIGRVLKDLSESTWDIYLKCIHEKYWLEIHYNDDDNSPYLENWEHLIGDTLSGDGKSELLQEILNNQEILEKFGPDQFNCIIRIIKTYYKLDFAIIVLESGEEPKTYKLGGNIDKFLVLLKDAEENYSAIIDQKSFYPDNLSYAQSLIEDLRNFKLLSNYFTQWASTYPTEEKVHKETQELFKIIANSQSPTEIYTNIFNCDKKLYPFQNLGQISWTFIDLNRKEFGQFLVDLKTAILNEINYQYILKVNENKDILHFEQIQCQELTEEREIEKANALKVIEADAKNLAQIDAEISKLGQESPEDLEKSKKILQLALESKEWIEFMEKLTLKSMTRDKLKVLKSLDFTVESKRPLASIFSELCQSLKIEINSNLQSRLDKNLQTDRVEFGLFLKSSTSDAEFCLKTQGDCKIYQVTGKNIFLSDVLGKCIEQAGTYEELRIIAKQTLVIDEDIDFTMGNVGLSGGSVQIHEDRKIDTSGQNGKPLETTEAGFTEAGLNGLEGHDGNDGINAGHVLISSTMPIGNLQNLEIICKGGNGSDGQNGANGGDGIDGENGEDAKIDAPSSLNVGSAYYFESGDDGKKGGDGGIGGKAGRGGVAGNYGRIEIINGLETIIVEDKSMGKFTSLNGTPGKHGKPGKGGDPGRGGRDGNDHAWTCEGRWTWHPWVESKGKLKIVDISNWFDTGAKAVEDGSPKVWGNGQRGLEGECQNTSQSKSNYAVKKDAINAQEISQDTSNDIKSNFTTEALDKTISDAQNAHNLNQSRSDLKSKINSNQLNVSQMEREIFENKQKEKDLLSKIKAKEETIKNQEAFFKNFMAEIESQQNTTTLTTENFVQSNDFETNTTKSWGKSKPHANFKKLSKNYEPNVQAKWIHQNKEVFCQEIFVILEGKKLNKIQAFQKCLQSLMVYSLNKGEFPQFLMAILREIAQSVETFHGEYSTIEFVSSIIPQTYKFCCDYENSEIIETRIDWGSILQNFGSIGQNPLEIIYTLQVQKLSRDQLQNLETIVAKFHLDFQNFILAILEKQYERLLFEEYLKKMRNGDENLGKYFSKGGDIANTMFQCVGKLAMGQILANLQAKKGQNFQTTARRAHLQAKAKKFKEARGLLKNFRNLMTKFIQVYKDLKVYLPSLKMYSSLTCEKFVFKNEPNFAQHSLINLTGIDLFKIKEILQDDRPNNIVYFLIPRYTLEEIDFIEIHDLAKKREEKEPRLLKLIDDLIQANFESRIKALEKNFTGDNKANFKKFEKKFLYPNNGLSLKHKFGALGNFERYQTDDGLNKCLDYIDKFHPKEWTIEEMIEAGKKKLNVYNKVKNIFTNSFDLKPCIENFNENPSNEAILKIFETYMKIHNEGKNVLDKKRSTFDKTCFHLRSRSYSSEEISRIFQIANAFKNLPSGENFQMKSSIVENLRQNLIKMTENTLGKYENEDWKNFEDNLMIDVANSLKKISDKTESGQILECLKFLFYHLGQLLFANGLGTEKYCSEILEIKGKTKMEAEFIMQLSDYLGQSIYKLSVNRTITEILSQKIGWKCENQLKIEDIKNLEILQKFNLPHDCGIEMCNCPHEYCQGCSENCFAKNYEILYSFLVQTILVECLSSYIEVLVKKDLENEDFAKKFDISKELKLLLTPGGAKFLKSANNAKYAKESRSRLNKTLTNCYQTLNLTELYKVLNGIFDFKSTLETIPKFFNQINENFKIESELYHLNFAQEYHQKCEKFMGTLTLWNFEKDSKKFLKDLAEENKIFDNQSIKSFSEIADFIPPTQFEGILPTIIEILTRYNDKLAQVLGSQWKKKDLKEEAKFKEMRRHLFDWLTKFFELYSDYIWSMSSIESKREFIQKIYESPSPQESSELVKTAILKIFTSLSKYIKGKKIVEIKVLAQACGKFPDKIKIKFFESIESKLELFHGKISSFEKKFFEAKLYLWIDQNGGNKLEDFFRSEGFDLYQPNGLDLIQYISLSLLVKNNFELNTRGYLERILELGKSNIDNDLIIDLENQFKSSENKINFIQNLKINWLNAFEEKLWGIMTELKPSGSKESIFYQNQPQNWTWTLRKMIICEFNSTLFVQNSPKNMHEILKKSHKFAKIRGEELHWFESYSQIVKILKKHPISLDKKELFFDQICEMSLTSVSHIIHSRFPQNWVDYSLINSITKSLELIGKCPQNSKYLSLNFQDGFENILNSFPDSPNKSNLFEIISLKLINFYKMFKGSKFDFDNFSNVLLQMKTITNYSAEILSNLLYSDIKDWRGLLKAFEYGEQHYSVETTGLLLTIEKSQNELLLKKFLTVFKKSFDQEDSEVFLNEILTKFMFREWELDEDLLLEMEHEENQEKFQNNEANFKKFMEDFMSRDLELLKDFRKLTANQNIIEHPKFEKLYGQIQEIKNHLEKPSKLAPQIQNNISTWNKETIGKWSKFVVKEIKLTVNEGLKNLVEILAVIYQAIHLETGDKPPRDTQLLSVLLFIDILKQKDNGRFGQISTGQGKTYIAAMFSIFLSLCQGFVNVVTSSPILAKEGCDDVKPIFKIFDITVTNNCDPDCQVERVLKERYNAKVIYGDVASFQSHILQTNFLKKEITRGRAPDFTIIDEVDSMLLDKGSNMLYVSHPIPEFRYLRPLFFKIWDIVQKTPQYGMDEKIDEIKQMIAEDKLKIPNFLKNYVDYRLKMWFESGYQAMDMKVKDPYIMAYENGEYRVMIVDKDTGVEQKNMQFSFGLHQFLQLKQGDRISLETLKAIFMSNLALFNDHSGRIFGITGTLGDQLSKDLLKSLYKADSYEMPRFARRKCKYFGGNVYPNEQEWIEGIKKSVEFKITVDKQGILIITETVGEAELIGNELNFLSPSQLFIYKSADDVKKLNDFVTKSGLRSDQVIIGTNLAGRGTDLTISGTLKAAKGMHVILTFMPRNSRVEEQAFGRTARSTDPGSIEFAILQAHPSLHTIIDHQAQRNSGETNRLDKMEKCEIPKIKLEKKLFKLFQIMYENFKPQFILIENDDSLDRRSLEENFLKNRWAIFLDKLHIKVANAFETGKQPVIDEFSNFEGEMKKLYEEESSFAQSSTEFMKLSRYFEEKKSYWPNKNFLDEALRYCEKAIEVDIDFSEVPKYYKASLLLKKYPDDHFQRGKILELLKQVHTTLLMRKFQIHSLMVTQIQVLRSKSGLEKPPEFALETQMNNEMNLTNIHLSCIKTLVGKALDLSLVMNEIPEVLDSEEALEILEIFKNIPKFIIPSKIDKKIELKIDMKYGRLVIIEGNEEIPLPNTHSTFSKLLEFQELLKFGQVIEFNQVGKLFMEDFWTKFEPKFVNSENKSFITDELEPLYHNHYSELINYTEIIRNFAESKDSQGKVTIDSFPLVKFHPIVQPIWTIFSDLEIITMPKMNHEFKDKIASELTSKKEKITHIYKKFHKNFKQSEFDEYCKSIEKAVVSSMGSLNTLEKVNVQYKNLDTCYKAGHIPKELVEYEQIGFERVIQVNEVVSWWKSGATKVALLGTLQILAGITLLIVTGGTGLFFGSMLITEGFGDIYYGYKTGFTNPHFSWTDYGISKGLSVGTSLALGAIGGAMGQSVARQLLTRFIIKSLLKQSVLVGINIAVEKGLDWLRTNFMVHLRGILQSFMKIGLNTHFPILMRNLQGNLSKVWKYSFDNQFGKFCLNAKKVVWDGLNSPFAQILYRNVKLIVDKIITRLTTSLAQSAGKYSGLVKIGTSIYEKYVTHASIIFKIKQTFWEFMEGALIRLNAYLEKKGIELEQRAKDKEKEGHAINSNGSKAQENFISIIGEDLTEKVVEKFQKVFLEPSIKDFAHTQVERCTEYMCQTNGGIMNSTIMPTESTGENDFTEENANNNESSDTLQDLQVDFDSIFASDGIAKITYENEIKIENSNGKLTVGDLRNHYKDIDLVFDKHGRCFADFD